MIPIFPLRLRSGGVEYHLSGIGCPCLPLVSRNPAGYRVLGHRRFWMRGLDV